MRTPWGHYWKLFEASEGDRDTDNSVRTSSRPLRVSDPSCTRYSYSSDNSCRPTGAFSKSRPILPCRISAWNGTTFAMLVGDLFRSLRHPRWLWRSESVRRLYGTGEFIGTTFLPKTPWWSSHALPCYNTNVDLDTGKLQNRFLC